MWVLGWIQVTSKVNGMAVEVGDVGAALDEASKLADDQATFASGKVFRFETEKEVLKKRCWVCCTCPCRGCL